MHEQDFINHTFMDHFLLTLNLIKNTSYNYPSIWLGETSSCYNGGAVNLSDRYVAGFLWLDKLGLGALHGVDVFIRQELVNANYAMLGWDMMPNPVSAILLVCVSKMVLSHLYEVQNYGYGKVRKNRHF